ncbi:hypothetical protein B0H14DRAFT_3139021 [Mycena olivaceomarginata]|nr:hypothetical protein B0H14DRAFT_3139021 [Mycena olivaceomarginata]
MRFWAIVATLILAPELHQLADDASRSAILVPGMPSNVEVTPQRTPSPSPGPIEQPSSGPNPIFDPSPPKRRGGQHTSIHVKRRRLAEKEQESWTKGETAAEASRRMQEELVEAAAEKAQREEVAAAKAERERTTRVRQALQALKDTGATSTYQFFEDFFSSTDREISRQAMGEHGDDLLDLLHAKRPKLVEKWALKVSLPVIGASNDADSTTTSTTTYAPRSNEAQHSTGCTRMFQHATRFPNDLG